MRIDVNGIAADLGLDFLVASAIKKEGLAELKEKSLILLIMQRLNLGKFLKQSIIFPPYQEMVLDRATALLIAEADSDLLKK